MITALSFVRASVPVFQPCRKRTAPLSLNPIYFWMLILEVNSTFGLLGRARDRQPPADVLINKRLAFASDLALLNSETGVLRMAGAEMWSS